VTQAVPPPRLEPLRARRPARRHGAVAAILAAAVVAACGAADRAPPAGDPTPVRRATAEGSPAADLLFVNGVVHRMTDGPRGATALAVVGDRIAWIGGDAQAGRWEGPRTRRVDLAGRALLPGLIDAHLHLESLAHHLADVDLVGTRSYAEVVQRVMARAAREPAGTWILGRGWDQNDWARPEFPHHELLSRAVPDHPVVLRRIGGHALLANRAALEAAGIDAESSIPDGGRMLLDPDGEPTGVLVDAAMALLDRAVPPVPRAVTARRVRAAIDTLHRAGITSIHDAGVDAEGVALFAEMARAGDFPLRSHVMIAADEPRLAAEPGETGWPTDDLTGQGLLAVRAIKLVADGALGSRGAALLDDYSDDEGNLGLLTTTAERALSLARFALDRGWQLCTHAIGDRANRLVLDAYEEAFDGRRAEGRGARFRVEHAQVLAADDVPRFAALGVIPSMQAQHQASDMPWAEARLGPVRVRGAYAWRSLVDAGSTIAGGSDCPVERADPIAALHAAVTRRDESLEPKGGWYPEQCLTREEALLSMTRWAAEAAFDEDRTGSLRPGMVADLVVLSADPMTVPDDALLDLRVDLTVFDGDVVFERSGAGRR